MPIKLFSQNKIEVENHLTLLPVNIESIMKLHIYSKLKVDVKYCWCDFEENRRSVLINKWTR